MVGRTSSALGVHSSQTVWGGGSSMDLSRTLVVRSAMRSASSTRMTRQRPVQGRRWASPMRVLTSSMVMMSFSVVRRTTSGWEPAMTSRQGLHCPHPGTGPVHCRAAAKARAAFERPDPGGPVTSQAWVMASPAAAAAAEPAPPSDPSLGARPVAACASRCSAASRAAWAAAVKAATALSWPTTSSHTLMSPPPRPTRWRCGGRRPPRRSPGPGAPPGGPRRGRGARRGGARRRQRPR